MHLLFSHSVLENNRPCSWHYQWIFIIIFRLVGIPCPFPSELYTKDAVMCGWNSLLMIIALEGTLSLTVPSCHWNAGWAGFSWFWADDVYLFFLNFLVETTYFLVYSILKTNFASWKLINKLFLLFHNQFPIFNAEICSWCIFSG